MQKLFFSCQSQHFDFDVVIYKLLFPICTLTWRVNIYVSRQVKSTNRRSESTEGQNFVFFPVVLTILTSISNFISVIANCKHQFDFPSRKQSQLLVTDNTFPIEMAILRNKSKLAALNKEKCEEHLRSNLVQNSIVPRSQKDYITQVCEEIEGRVTKKLSQEFSRTENCILGGLPSVDDFLMNR